MLTRDQLLKPKTTTINVDGGSLLIRALSAEYAMGLRGRDLQGADIFQVIADSIVDENGVTMLTGAEVGTLAISTLEQIVKQVFEFNALGKKAGVALNPATSLQTIGNVLDDIDLLLIMTVNPGWGGQKYIAHSTAKIREAATLIGTRSIHLEVDGGINPETARAAVSAGANVLVAGTSVFQQKDYAAAISALSKR